MDSTGAYSEEKYGLPDATVTDQPTSNQYGMNQVGPGDPSQPPQYAAAMAGGPPPQYAGMAAGQPPPPGAPVWMMKPPVLPGCPPGLEYLSQIDQFIVQQEVFALEVITSWEKKNRFRVCNSLSQQIYYAAEESSCLMRQCCGPSRGFELIITDNLGQEVMKFIRKFKCFAGCCWCACSDHCAFYFAVEAPIGNPIGYVRQQKSAWKPVYSLYSADDEVIGHIKGPCCPCHCICNSCSDLNFPVYSADMSTEIGKINKQWGGIAREMFTDASHFGVSFPLDMDVKMKAVIMAATFLIDIMYFEHKNN